MNLLYVFEQGDPVLLGVFLLLAAMSVVSWYIIFQKAWKLRMERQLLARFRERHMQAADWPKHSPFPQAEGCVAALLREAERHKSAPQGNAAQHEKALSLHLSQALDSVRVWLDRGLTVLASVGSSAPFIGLFGTVWGIYNTLTRIGMEESASLNVVAAPIGEALVATAVGLFAAIPAVLAYNGFVRANRLLMQDLRHVAEQLTFYLSLPQAAPHAHAEAIKLVQGAR